MTFSRPWHSSYAPGVPHEINPEKITLRPKLLPRAQKIRPATKIEAIITCHISDYLPFPKKQLFPFVKKTMYRKVVPEPGVYPFLDLVKANSPDPVPSRGGGRTRRPCCTPGAPRGSAKGRSSPTRTSPPWSSSSGPSSPTCRQGSRSWASTPFSTPPAIP